jgi:hypothetical protein
LSTDTNSTAEKAVTFVAAFLAVLIDKIVVYEAEGVGKARTQMDRIDE